MIQNKNMWQIVAVLILCTIVQSQKLEKSGSCPPPTPIEICFKACYNDGHCVEKAKCCPTACGGAVCTKPVSELEPNIPKVKAGICPEASGPWVCSNTCTLDADCRGRLKCCKNRCGALICTKPEV